MNILQEFKAFAMRGNVVDIAVGIIIGAAFGKIISSLVNDLLMPPIGMLLGGMNFADIKILMKDAVTDPATGKVLKEAVALKIGSFIQTIIDFLIIAFSIFMLIKGMNTMSRKNEEVPSPPAEPTKEEILLGEIRDILKNK